MSRLRLAPLAVLLAVAAGVACTEEGLTGTDDVPPPGQAADAVSAIVPADELPRWRDTTFSGYATTRDVPYVFVVDQPPLRSRALFRVADVPDSIGGLPVDTVGSMSLRVLADTTRSVFTGDSSTLELHSLGRDFTVDEVDWNRAAEGTPWSEPGGGLEARLASLDVDLSTLVDTVAPTVSVPFGPDPDSLVAAWSDAGRVPPLALVLEGEGNRLVVRDLRLAVRARNAEMDSLERIEVGLDAATFIHDPPLPDPGRRLRVGGLPSSRAYFTFRPPDSVQGVALQGSRVNRAEIVFHPVSEPGSPFRPPVIVTAVANGLLSDPFTTGPRAPIGPPVGERDFLVLHHDSLAAGRPLRLQVTDLVQTWASAETDTTDEFRITVRPQPDGQDLGFWEFGSEESDPGVRPELRLLITPPTDFQLP